MSMFRRAMDYLGLGPDEAYDDYDESVAVERDRRMPSRGRQRAERFDDLEPGYDDYDDRAMGEPRSSGMRTQQAQHDSGVTVRPVAGRRTEAVARPVLPASDPVTIRPTSYEDAKEIADRFKEGNPVIINVQSTDQKTMRRIIDFASGVCYANNGTMEKMSNGVFMMKPFGARVTRG
ncbi:MAG: cell division protein SepF [Actinobacteria bacterium]|nr:cell division protein SepF [Actinomycetota bacterium]